MKIAYATTFDGRDVLNWSGTPYYMSQTLQQEGVQVDYIGSLKRRLPRGFKIKQLWNKFSSGQRESPRFNTVAAQYYSEQVANQIKLLDVQAVISPLINPVAYLECKQPTVLWTDALYASLLGFYSPFHNHSAASIRQGNKITSACLERVDLAIFCSDWAARSATELYGIHQDKVKVVPFGANIQTQYTLDDIRNIIRQRSRTTLKFLFIGKHWERKGGAIVFAVVKALHAAGQPVELHFVGCQPPAEENIPSFIHCHGFISKRTPEGVARLQQLLHDSHFLFVPSRAEAYGIVFCEANAYGLPCLTSYVGGIATVVRDNINGMTFALDAPVARYCDYILDLMRDYSKYEALALSSFNEYQTRLNWNSAVRHVKQLIQEKL
jgi:glycosyltransferase involved in cell wall biosynthesis